MSDMKCPFCKKELKLIGEKSNSGFPIDEYNCSCPETAFSFGNTVMWNNLRVLHENLEERRKQCEVAEKELIRTRKALDVALCSLQDIAESNGDFITGASTTLDAHEYAEMMLYKVKTALEQKDVK